jgi:hypothetical protein
VALNDQRTLLELTRRGEQARADAVLRARQAQELLLDRAMPHEGLSLAATGIASNFSERIFRPEMPERIGAAVWGDAAGPQHEGRRPVWAPAHLGVFRQRALNLGGPLLGGATVTREGAVFIYRGFSPEHEAAPGLHDALSEAQLRERFGGAFRAAQELLLESGAHGDVFAVYRLTPNGRRVMFTTRDDIPSLDLAEGALHTEVWTTLDAEPPVDLVFDEVARAAGLGPA